MNRNLLKLKRWPANFVGRSWAWPPLSWAEYDGAPTMPLIGQWDPAVLVLPTDKPSEAIKPCVIKCG